MLQPRFAPAGPGRAGRERRGWGRAGAEPTVAPPNTQPQAEGRLATRRGATHHDGEDEGDNVDGIGGTEAGEDAEEQVVLGPRLRRLVGQLILDVGLGAVLQSPLDVGTGGERRHGAAVRRAGGSESPAPRTGQAGPRRGAEPREPPGAAPPWDRHRQRGGGGCPPTVPLARNLLTREKIHAREREKGKVNQRRRGFPTTVSRLPVAGDERGFPGLALPGPSPGAGTAGPEPHGPRLFRSLAKL